jgi:hypothetical protein
MWRFPADIAMTPVEGEAVAFTCSAALPARLAVGGTGRVLPGDPNRVRSVPALDGELVGQIPSGETFSVIGGPVCGGDLVWWQVTYGDVSGWTAEGVDDYFVEPVQ